MTDLAATWRQAMQRARTLNPERVAAYIVEGADIGLRASRYDAQGGRTTRVPCDDPEHCDDGPQDHSHLVVSDPTGNAATRGRGRDSSTDDHRQLKLAAEDMVRFAGVVLHWVSGDRPTSWSGVVLADAKLMPGSVQAGLDVDDERRLPHAIVKVERAVTIVAAIAGCHVPREATQDEQHWTAGLAPEDCCRWHFDVKPVGRYRRPRVGGTNVCRECLQVTEWAGRKPPEWFMDALIERDAKPKAYERALSRLADELEVPAHHRVG